MTNKYKKDYNEMLVKYIFSSVSCIMIYWLSNSVLWIPWKFAPWFGAICMLIYVPVAWGGISYLCLGKFEKHDRKKAKYIIGICFVIIAFLSDFIFYVGYRHIPEQLYKPATYGAYFLCFISPILVGGLLQKKEMKSKKRIRAVEWALMCIAAVVFVLMTFYVVRFW